MSKLNYCIKCGEACETETVIATITEFSGGWYPRINWKTRTFAICVNEDCPRHGLLSMRVLGEKPKRKKK